MNWRWLFPLVFLFSCVDGFIANLLYPARLPLLYRDFLVLGTYLCFFFQEPAGRWFTRVHDRMGSVVWTFGLTYALICLLQVFNPYLPNLAVGFLGLKIAIFYWPLLLLSYAYNDTPQRARRFIWAIVAFSVPIHLFGMYQFIQGPEYLADTFGPGFERSVILAFFEGAAVEIDTYMRVLGTFASSGQYTTFVVIDAAYIFALLLSAEKRWERILLRLIAVLNFVVLLATGSRGGVLCIGVLTLIMGLFYSGIRRFISLSLLIGVGLFIGFHWMGEAVTKRFETLREIDMITERTIDTTPIQFMELFNKAPLGRGIGMGSTAARHITDSGQSDIQMVENQLSKIQMETGIGGVTTFYGFAFGLILQLLLHWRDPRNKETGALLGPLAAYCVALLALSFLIGGFDSPPASLFFWATLGLVARLSAGPDEKPIAAARKR